MDQKSIIEKIKALLTLAEDAGATDSEGETAARMAQLLMSKYGIAEEAVRQAAAAEGHAPKAAPIESERHGKWRSRPTWVGQLMSAVATHNGCYVYWEHVWSDDAMRFLYALRVCGTEHNRELAIALFSLLQEQVERFTKRSCKGKGRTYANNFRLGMVTRLNERLREAAKQAEQEARQEATGSALVLVDKAILARREACNLARKWVQSNGVTLRSHKTYSQRDAEARQHGYREGNKATLHNDRMGA